MSIGIGLFLYFMIPIDSKIANLFLYLLTTIVFGEPAHMMCKLQIFAYAVMGYKGNF